MSTSSQSKKKVVIVGAGFSGAIVAYMLQRLPSIEVILIEKSSGGSLPETATGLNLNPNGLAALEALDRELCNALRAKGLPRGVMSATHISGKSLFRETIYDGNSSCLADSYGLRVRWRDAYSVIRSKAEVMYDSEVVSVSFDSGNVPSLTYRNTQDGSCKTIEDIDLIVAADGRYSKIREQLSRPQVSFIGVSNFRVLMPDTSGGLFDDMELIYCDPSAAGRQGENERDFSWSLNGLSRVGIMRMPFTDSGRPELYMYGNFAIRDEIPDHAKTPEGLISLFTPTSGVLSRKGAYLHKCFREHASRMHWARMQYIDPVYRDGTNRVLFLGDAAHATVPTLGQGATSAIEDACVAAYEISAALESSDEAALPSAVARIDSRCRPRAEQITSISVEASRHLMVSGWFRTHALRREIAKWTDHGSQYRAEYRRLMREYPLSADAGALRATGSLG